MSRTERTEPTPARQPRTRTTWLLLLAVAAIAVLPIAVGAGDHLTEPYAGADSQAEDTVGRLDPGYTPWFSPLYEAPSSEVESGLFALQAAIGAGIIGYYFGAVRTRARLRRDGDPSAGS